MPPDTYSVSFTWDKIGPRAEERLLAGKVAGVLWLCVLPMLGIVVLLPGSAGGHWQLVLLLTAPATAWGLACLFFMPWERVATPLFFHAPASLALPYIALLVGLTGTTDSPFSLTLLMLLAFCAYFFPPRAALPYVVGCLAVQALPLVYDRSAAESGLLAEIWVALFVYASVGGVIMVGKDQLLALRKAAEHLSLHDSLTGLWNRRALVDLLAAHHGGTRRHDAIGLLLIDLDDFKEANTLHGLPGGDRVLCAVSDALLATARAGDAVVRLGGDEFAILAPGVTVEGMERLSARTLQAIRAAVEALKLSRLTITASAGWAMYPQDAQSVDELITQADLALRGAKLKGKDRAQAAVAWEAELAS